MSMRDGCYGGRRSAFTDRNIRAATSGASMKGSKCRHHPRPFVVPNHSVAAAVDPERRSSPASRPATCCSPRFHRAPDRIDAYEDAATGEKARRGRQVLRRKSRSPAIIFSGGQAADRDRDRGVAPKSHEGMLIAFGQDRMVTRTVPPQFA